ncbi:hypothetical protein LC653_08760 [Nostoc sp. CHAB 5784]|uniref:hypothetical protein n=1 Tax=Nostoc mirabile TaxID=2907820 RepID=UPI001E45CB8D|nr:hypothetical protein [Nostoc mirabile]MCC5664009.1 hypothetical protein [Nostoc mirabile CHAB5784]
MATQIQSTTVQIQSTTARIQSTTARIQSTTARIQSTTVQIQSTTVQIQSTTVQIQSTTVQILYRNLANLLLLNTKAMFVTGYVYARVELIQSVDAASVRQCVGRVPRLEATAEPGGLVVRHRLAAEVF